jgi:hypothetical protein
MLDALPMGICITHILLSRLVVRPAFYFIVSTNAKHLSILAGHAIHGQAKSQHNAQQSMQSPPPAYQSAPGQSSAPGKSTTQFDQEFEAKLQVCCIFFLEKIFPLISLIVNYMRNPLLS